MDIYTAVPPTELMFSRGILCSQLDSCSVKVQTARQQANVHQPTQQPDGFLIEAGQGALLPFSSKCTCVKNQDQAVL